MAFPAVQTADTKTGTQASNSTSWTLTYPTNLASGDLILAFVGTDGNPGVTFPALWERYNCPLAGGGAAASLYVGAKISVGSETGNFTLTVGATEQGAWRIFRITGWNGAALPSTSNNLTAGVSNSDSMALFGSSATTGNPDPPNLDPGNWATEDTLWIAACGVDTSRTISVFPLTDLNTADVSGGSTGATLGLCMKNDTVSSLNPGTFTISASDDWAAATVAVRPTAGTTYTKAGFGKESA